MITIRGNSRNLTKLSQGLRSNPHNTVPVVFIGTVPRFKKIAFGLVLKNATQPKPEEYKVKRLRALFGNVLPREIFFYLPSAKKKGKELNEPLDTLTKEKKVAINYEWAQVAVAQEFRPYQTKTNKARLTPEMLARIQWNMSKNEIFGFRCRTDMTQMKITRDDVRRGRTIGCGIGI
jgi:hypothetical protein